MSSDSVFRRLAGVALGFLVFFTGLSALRAAPFNPPIDPQQLEGTAVQLLAGGEECHSMFESNKLGLTLLIDSSDEPAPVVQAAISDFCDGDNFTREKGPDSRKNKLI